MSWVVALLALWLIGALVQLNRIADHSMRIAKSLEGLHAIAQQAQQRRQ